VIGFGWQLELPPRHDQIRVVERSTIAHPPVAVLLEYFRPGRSVTESLFGDTEERVAFDHDVRNRSVGRR
jgi:hypothetical protein